MASCFKLSFLQNTIDNILQEIKKKELKMAF